MNQPPVNPLPQAFIFDMDGTLYDSERLHILAWQDTLGPLGLNFDDAWFLPWIGVVDQLLAEHLSGLLNGIPAAGQLLETKGQIFREHVSRSLRPFEGIADALDEAAALGLPLAICSSARRRDVLHALEATGLLPRFRVVVGLEDVTNPKPAPDPFAQTARQLGIAPGNCVVFEDSPTGIEAARAAGCQVCAVTTTHAADRLGAADHIFSSTVEAIAWAIQLLGAVVPPGAGE